jgi:hypothetical protein
MLWDKFGIGNDEMERYSGDFIALRHCKAAHCGLRERDDVLGQCTSAYNACTSTQETL